MALTLGLTAAIGFGVGLRLVEWPAWNVPTFQFAGRPLLPNFDAYGWLAGARCVGRFAGEPLPLLLRFLAWLLPFPLETIAFYLPVVCAPLAAWPMVRLMRGLGAPEAGFGAAVCVVAAPAYVYRTRLGFCDTDMLLVPLACLALCSLTLWPGRECPDAASPAGRYPESLRHCLLAAVSLALMQGMHPGSRPLLVAAAALFVATAWKAARSSGFLLVQAVAVVLAALAGVWGFVAGLACLVWACRRVGREQCLRRRWIWALAALPAVAAMWVLPDVGRATLRSAHFFLDSLVRTLSPGGGASDVAASVLEAQRPDWRETTRQAAFHWSLSLVAAAAYSLALVRRPRLLAGLPWAALALASPVSGIRFAMYGGLVTGVGLPLALASLTGRLRRGRRLAAVVLQGGLVITVGLLAWRDAATLRPFPVISSGHAAALARLDALAAPDAQIWTWWDYGYAAQFFAGRTSFADPGNNTGAVLTLLSRVLAADDPAVAAREVFDGAARQAPAVPSRWERWVCPDGVRRQAPFPEPEVAGEAAQPVDHLPPQYVVVSWEGLRTGRWPLWFARPRQDRQNHQPPPWPLADVSPKRLNIDKGWVEVDGTAIALAELDVLDGRGGRLHRTWDREKGFAAVVNLGDAALLLFDAASRRALFARLLLDDPGLFAPHFELVVDKAPWARIYQVRP